MMCLGFKTLREELNIDITEGLKAKALGPSAFEMGSQVAAGRIYTNGKVSACHVPMLVSGVMIISSREQGAFEENESIKKALLATGSAMVIKLKLEHMFREEIFPETPR